DDLNDREREFLVRSESQSRRRLLGRSLAVFLVIVLIRGGIAVQQWLRAERLSALLHIERGLSYCEQGEISSGLLWLARSLKAIPTKDEDLQRSIRMQLSSWRPQLHQLRERLPHKRPVWAVAFAPDGKLVLTGSDDGTARLWDVASGRLTATLEHGGLVRSVAFASDGKAVLIGSDNGTARLWDTTGKPIGPLLRL